MKLILWLCFKCLHILCQCLPHSKMGITRLTFIFISWMVLLPQNLQWIFMCSPATR